MASTGVPWLWFVVGVFGAFAVLGMLRVLACYCEHHVSTHNAVCEVRRMRNDYLRRLHERQQHEVDAES